MCCKHTHTVDSVTIHAHLELLREAQRTDKGKVSIAR